jgi:hypothetical protein
MNLGFIGSKDGMTQAQREWVAWFLAHNCEIIKEAHHCDSNPVDDQFDNLVREYAMGFCVIFAHPANVEAYRAYVDYKTPKRGKPALKTTMLKERPFILRECDILEACDTLIFAPRTRDETRYSPLWYAHKRALDMGRMTYLIMPNGEQHV